MLPEELYAKAKQIRIQTLTMLGKAGTGHPGGSLSVTDLLVGLYCEVMNVYPDPNDNRRDRLVLSKGHSNPPLYAILADKGYFPESTLWTLRDLGSKLQGHPDMKKTPGIDCSTGSLGQGISVGTGMALSFKAQHMDNHVYVLTGDGELQEGLVWEACMAAAHYHLDNLTVIVDRNCLQIDGNTEEVMALGDVQAKFRAFGFHTLTIDGHRFEDILPALRTHEPGKPVCIIANTVKGKGVSYMENEACWHGGVPKADMLAQALKELEAM